MQKSVIKILFLFFIVCVCACNGTSDSTPSRECPVTIDWQGIVPGVTQKDEVLRILGEPLRLDDSRSDLLVAIFKEGIDNRMLESPGTTYIIFDESDTVIYINRSLVDEDRYYQIADFLILTGNTFDIIYANTTGNPYYKKEGHGFSDFQVGFDQIWTASFCGLELDTIPFIVVDDLGELKCKIGETEPTQSLAYEFSTLFKFDEDNFPLLIPSPMPQTSNYVQAVHYFPRIGYSAYWEKYSQLDQPLLYSSWKEFFYGLCE
jgi:hypothetical protein